LTCDFTFRIPNNPLHSTHDEIFDDLFTSSTMPTEDELYRSSSQYRHWNFTPQRLAALRQKTNTLAQDHVRAALKRKRTPIAQDGLVKTENDENGDREVEYLTVVEEKALVDFFCLQLMGMAQLDTVKFPINITVSHGDFR
jgi:cyclin H